MLHCGDDELALRRAEEVRVDDEVVARFLEEGADGHIVDVPNQIDVGKAGGDRMRVREPAGFEAAPIESSHAFDASQTRERRGTLEAGARFWQSLAGRRRISAHNSGHRAENGP